MGRYVLQFQEIDQTQVAVVGGKGAHLGELSRLEGLRVPDGFCVTTDAFQRVMAEAVSLDDRLDRLSLLKPDDREAIAALSAELRQDIEAIALPDDLAAAITRPLAEHAAYAVRSSATAEDLPAASFAGQHDTYLNVIGTPGILEHVRRCWASLFTERAVTYRLKNGIDHRQVRMAVVVQRLIVPEAAGTLFTADPATSHRKVTTIEASFGLGEALVSGLLTPDSYKVLDGKLIDRKVSTKSLAIRPAPAGGTIEQEIDPGQQGAPVLTEEQILRLEALGRQVEAHFGCPQDLEWCLADGSFHVVQSRPITTLFPIPEAADDAFHVYASVGHQQMMTDALKPLGLSVYQLTGLIHRPEAGGRLFVDISAQLATSAGRAMLLGTLGKSDPLTRDALLTLMDRLGPVAPPPEEGPQASPGDRGAPAEADPSVVETLTKEALASIEELRRTLPSKSGPELFDFVREDLELLKKQMTDPRSVSLIWAGPGLVWWLNDHMQEWLGETNVADTLCLSVPDNVTAQMGLDLLDVADVIRAYPEVVAFLEQATEETYLDALAGLEGGQASSEAIRGFLDRYGMRCAAEIDITRPRWGEKPTTLLPMLLGNIRNFAPGESRRRFEKGRQEAVAKAQDLLSRLRQLPDGERRAEETRRKIETLRAITGYREFPKYAIVSRYYLYKQALAREAERLVEAGVVRDKADVDYLTFQEFQEAVRTQDLDTSLIERRKAEHELYRRLSPPRLLTSDGEVLTGAYRRDDLPAGALVGMPVSRGVVEGRARVVLDMARARLEAGDILVTRFTDPGWTPLFVAVGGLVTEVGGLMTHGAVIAREYGLPAVVGVENATSLIQDGQRIRVNGTDGFVEIL